ncbi:MAG: endolytic transglycosylase MltG [Patescibacteria group bacterium]
MTKFQLSKKPRGRMRWRKVAIISLVVIATLMSAALIGSRVWYDQNLGALTSESRIITVDIPLGSSVDNIANLLKKEGVIRNTQAFKIYVRGNEKADALRFGVYDFDSSLTVPEIVEILVSGQEASELFTIPPGLRLDQVRARFIKNGYSEVEVDAALEPTQYENHPALVSKPKGDSLEGYLYPESFQRTSATTAKAIVGLSLDEMAKRLTPDRIEAFSRQGLSPHEAVIVASIIEKEVHLAEDRLVVAQIFLKRLSEGIQLGSDVTYEYASAVNGGIAWPGLEDPYNTRLYSGLPPGPIANFDVTALEAVANPADTDYLFFLSGDDDKTYYGKTLAEHDENIREHCQIKCK